MIKVDIFLCVCVFVHMLLVDADGRCPVVNMAIFQIFTVQETINFLP